ncbi:DUF4913 domain-containing protein [Streptomyces sp. NPDC088847]|uniref:DUF4913 domain-containing protein n=1 Tax=Streptomyces sp. NPDC088847 TaxID=3365909 RepID=UPI003818C344
MTTWEGDYELAAPLTSIGALRDDSGESSQANSTAPVSNSPTPDPPVPSAGKEPPESEGETPPLKSQFILYLEGPEQWEAMERLVIWVHYLMIPVYAGETTSSQPWCPRWWEHADAVAYLYALWMAWQELTDANGGLTGPGMWHRDFLTPTMVYLRNPSGPFAGCKPGAHLGKERPIVDEFIPYFDPNNPGPGAPHEQQA